MYRSGSGSYQEVGKSVQNSIIEPDVIYLVGR